LPICHSEIILLPEVCYETIEIDYGYKFCVKENYVWHLSIKGKIIIDKVIKIYGNLTREEIVKRMHQEDAYKLTKK